MGESCVSVKEDVYGDEGRIRYSRKEDIQEDDREINLQKFFYW